MAEDPTAGRTRKLTELRRLDSADKTRRVLAALDATISAGKPLTIAALARHARVSRRFICDHPELAPWRSARTPVLLEGSASGHRPPPSRVFMRALLEQRSIQVFRRRQTENGPEPERYEASTRRSIHR